MILKQASKMYAMIDCYVNRKRHNSNPYQHWNIQLYTEV